MRLALWRGTRMEMEHLLCFVDLYIPKQLWPTRAFGHFIKVPHCYIAVLDGAYVLDRLRLKCKYRRMNCIIHLAICLEWSVIQATSAFLIKRSHWQTLILEQAEDGEPDIMPDRTKITQSVTKKPKGNKSKLIDQTFIIHKKIAVKSATLHQVLTAATTAAKPSSLQQVFHIVDAIKP